MLHNDGQTISMVMIARDEEHNIARALNSVKGLVDEMIVVDTGSIDKTVELAESLGAKVFHFPWQNDFSAAKNFAIEQTSADWLLLMDADDEIHQEDRNKIRELLQETDVDCFFFDTLSFFGEAGGLYVRMLQSRLIRNRPQFRFSGRIHETINFRDAIVAYTEIRVNHYGYLNREVETKQKIKRNRVLLEKEVDDNPTALTYFYLGTEDLRAGDYEEALGNFQRSHQLYVEAGLKPSSEMLKKKIIALQELGRFSDAHAEIDLALQLYPDYTDLLFLKGECFERQGNIVQSVQTYRTCLEQGEAPIEYSSMSGVGSFTAYYRIGLLLSDIGNSEEAIEAYLDSLRLNTAYIPAIHAIAEELLKNRSVEEAISFIGNRFDMNVPVANRYFAEAFANIGAFQLALYYVNQFERGNPPLDDEMVLLKARCLLLGEDREQAMDLFESISPLSPKYFRASFQKCIYFWLNKKYTDASRILEELKEANRFAPYEVDICLTVNRILADAKTELPSRQFNMEMDHKMEEAVISLLEMFVFFGKTEWIEKIRLHLPDRLKHKERLTEFINLLYKRQKMAEAERWLEKIEEAERWNIEAAILHGEIYLAMGKYHMSHVWFKHVLDLSPFNIKGILGLSNISYAYYLESMEAMVKGFTHPLRQNKISLCMIVKNEEKNLPNALESVKGIVDEIIIVDTGSADGTVKIAEEWGAKVFHFSWNGDFAAARNFAIEQAAGEWILMMDADERLDQTGKAMLPDLVTNMEIYGYFLTIKSKIDDSHTVIDRRLSLFRNKPDYRFEGPIHEQIPSSKFWANGQRLEVADLIIHHDGYMENLVKEKNKSIRNLEIIYKQLSLQPEHPFYHYCLAAELMQQEQYREAAEHLRFALTQWPPEQPQFSDAICKIGQCYLMGKEYGECEQWLRKGIQLFPNFTDLHYFLGICFLEQGKWQESIDCLQTCLQSGDPPPHYNSFEGASSYHAYYALALALRETNKIEESNLYLLKGLECKPDFQQAFLGLEQNWKLMSQTRIQMAKKVLQLGLFYFPASTFLKEKISQLKKQEGTFMASVQESDGC